MEKYDIFKSEGGFRVCGSAWNGEPVIDASPWFPTLEQAEERARKMKAEDIEAAALDIVSGMAPAKLYPKEVRERARQIQSAAQEMYED